MNGRPVNRQNIKHVATLYAWFQNDFIGAALGRHVKMQSALDYFTYSYLMLSEIRATRNLWRTRQKETDDLLLKIVEFNKLFCPTVR